jgi:predicted nucleotidyltransferase
MKNDAAPAIRSHIQRFSVGQVVSGIAPCYHGDMNISHRIALPDHLAENEKEALVNLLARLRQQFEGDLLRVVLFGSKARGDYDEESDLDLLIVLRMNRSSFKAIREQIINTIWEVEMNCDVVISLILKSEEAFARMQADGLLLYRNIAEQGIPLWTNLSNKPTFAFTWKEREMI